MNAYIFLLRHRPVFPSPSTAHRSLSCQGLAAHRATVQPNSPHIQGLYHDVLPTREEVFPASLSFAKELAANTSQVSIAYAKGLLHHPGNTVEETFLLESRALAEASKSRDAEELTHAFFERRRPNLKDTVSKNMPEWYPWVSSNHACKRPFSCC